MTIMFYWGRSKLKSYKYALEKGALRGKIITENIGFQKRTERKKHRMHNFGYGLGIRLCDKKNI